MPGDRQRGLFPWWVSFHAEFLESLRNETTVFLAVIQPVVYMTLTLGSTQANAGTKASALVGAITMALWSTTQWASGSVVSREMTAGTFGGILSRPTPMLAVVSMKGLGASAAGLVLSVPSAVGVALLMGVPMSWRTAGVLVLLAGPAVLCGTAMGLLLTTLVVVTRAGIRLVSTLTFPMLLLGGFLIPASALPPYARWFADLVPLHWIADVMSALLVGRAPSIGSVAMLVVLTASYWEIGRRLLAVSVRRCLTRGELDVR
ncbi:ABC transporter permease [Streptomyces sp. NPDC008001]|uniref:ABC transporter permease n=1 Tax=Streptomyces sp. NPDC008001 TaxID=3364804 RepID=UPI0036E51622